MGGLLGVLSQSLVALRVLSALVLKPQEKSDKAGPRKEHVGVCLDRTCSDSREAKGTLRAQR